MIATTALTAWFCLLLIAVPYVLRMRHPATRPLVAYLVFVMEFSLLAGVIYFAALRLLAAFDADTLLNEPGGVAVLAALVLLPSFALSHWHLRRPPAARRHREPD